MGTHAAERTRPIDWSTKLQTDPRQHGRRAMQSLDSATAVAVTDPTTAGLRRIAMSSLTGAAVLAGLVATQAAPAVTAYKTLTKAESPMTETQAAITAASDVTLTSDTVKVSTEAAPAVVPAPKAAPVAQPVVQAKTQVVADSAQVPAPAVAAVAPAANSDRASAIVAAAYAQLGQIQDCTMLVTRSLAAVGINFHGWPADYYSLGAPVSADAALPGDLIFYANGGYGGVAHIAIYIGDGKAIHGGWNGNQTVIFSSNVGSGPAFIRLR